MSGPIFYSWLIVVLLLMAICMAWMVYIEQNGKPKPACLTESCA